MKKSTEIILLLLFFCLTEQIVFAADGLRAADVYDAAVTPLPEWVLRKIKRNERPVMSGYWETANTSGFRRIKEIIDGDRMAWYYNSGMRVEAVYIVTYNQRIGRNVWLLYINN